MNGYLIPALALAFFSSTESMSSRPQDDDIGSGPRAVSKSTKVTTAAEESAALLQGRLLEENLKKNLEELKKLNAEKEAKYKQEVETIRKAKKIRDKEAAENQRLREELEMLQKQIREQEKLSAPLGQQEKVKEQTRVKK